ncbi:ubiquitin-conjugating enzyme [Ophiocordyceps camponoti-floridani]|uniref:Ubiquitin-conjugating enzyme n=1 Tax=Ophiocordyceps camponoti-floridani TaxID=2030778 RepID=A0A8H4Q6U0_9HYPO|nr:ubiquitin-conjugating enzyme [Ophiocordyceps camponoti-floridani]
MAHSKSLSPDTLPSLRRQHLYSEFAGLKQACPEGVFVSLTPGDATLWTAVLFVRDGPYAQGVLRFQISFPDAFPSLPPVVTFSTDMFHPLISPLSTYMYTTDSQVNGTVSARDDERLPPGGFSLRHGFPHWFGRARRLPPTGDKAFASPSAKTSRDPSTVGSPESAARTPPAPKHPSVSMYQILKYIRSSFDDEHVLDSVPLEAAGNPGAWHAWRTHRRALGKLPDAKSTPEIGAGKGQDGANSNREGSIQAPEWNWDGVWEDRVTKGIAASLSDPVLYGGAGPDELIRFLAMEEADVTSVKDNIYRLLGNANTT